MYRRDDIINNIDSSLKTTRTALSFRVALVIVTTTLAGLCQNILAETLSDRPQVTEQTAAKNQQHVLFDVAPFVAEYKVETDALPLSGEGLRTLKHLGAGHYRMEQIAKSFLLTRREISEFSMNGCHLTPKSYRYEQSGIGRDRRQLIDFHTAENRATYEANKQKSHIKLPIDTVFYDRLSETLALQCQLLQRKASAEYKSKPITLHVIDKGQLRQHIFAIVGEEKLNVAKTEMQTIKVQRVRDGGHRETTLWFAPRQSYALVKMKQVNKGKTITFELKSIKQVF